MNTSESKKKKQFVSNSGGDGGGDDTTNAILTRTLVGSPLIIIIHKLTENRCVPFFVDYIIFNADC